MRRNKSSKAQHNNLSIVKKIGISIIIPIFLAVLGGLLILVVGWNYIAKTYFIGSVIFNKPVATLDRYEYNINGKKFYAPVNGDKIARIKIPSVEIDNDIYQGDDEPQLSIGIGHNFYSSLPGEGGNVVLAGHRDSVFGPLEYIKEGDEVIVETNYGTYYYEVSVIRITNPDDMTVTAPSNKEMLTMYTCYPFSYIGNAPQRYIVQCEFLRVE